MKSCSSCSPGSCTWPGRVRQTERVGRVAGCCTCFAFDRWPGDTWRLDGRRFQGTRNAEALSFYKGFPEACKNWDVTSLPTSTCCLLRSITFYCRPVWFLENSSPTNQFHVCVLVNHTLSDRCLALDATCSKWLQIAKNTDLHIIAGPLLSCQPVLSTMMPCFLIHDTLVHSPDRLYAKSLLGHGEKRCSIGYPRTVVRADARHLWKRPTKTAMCANSLEYT